MKTIEELYKEIAASKELQEELKNASEETLEAFLKKHDCHATAKEFVAFARAQSEGEIGDEETENISGGFHPWISPHSKVSQFEVL